MQFAFGFAMIDKKSWWKIIDGIEVGQWHASAVFHAECRFHHRAARVCGRRDAIRRRSPPPTTFPRALPECEHRLTHFALAVSCLLEIEAVYKSQTCEMNWLISVGKATCATQLRPMRTKRRKINNKFPHRVGTPAKKKNTFVAKDVALILFSSLPGAQFIFDRREHKTNLAKSFPFSFTFDISSPNAKKKRGKTINFCPIFNVSSDPDLQSLEEL